MMSTPTPTSRRPRPPSSLAAKSRLSTSSSTSSSVGKSAKGDPPTSPLGPGNKPQKQSSIFTSRRDAARSILSRVSASPSDIGNVSLGLDIMSPDNASTSHISTASASSPGHGNFTPSVPAQIEQSNLLVEPSPPPPYGRDLPDTSPIPKAAIVTPPRQDLMDRPGSGRAIQEGRVEQEEWLRARRAAEAAKAIGLDMDFGVSNSGGDDDSEDLEDDEEELRSRLRSVRRRLRQRDKELLMAAQVADQALRQHEQVLSQLSPTAKSHLPQLLTLLAVAPAGRARTSSRPPSRTGSLLSDKVSPPNSRFRHSTSHSIASISSILSPTFGRHSPSLDTARSPDRPSNFHLVNGQPEYYRKASRPRAFHPHPSTPTQRYHSLQVEEAEQRIVMLETALMEAQAGEENQRKAAARMKRDNDKMKRDLERAEGMLSDMPAISGLTRVTGLRGQRERDVQEAESSRAGLQRSNTGLGARRPYDQEMGPSRSPSADRLPHLGGESSTMRQARRRSIVDDRGPENPRGNVRRNSPAPSSSTVPPSAPSWQSEIRPTGGLKRVRKAVSRSSFLSPAKVTTKAGLPLTPKLHIQSPETLEPVPLESNRDSTLRHRHRPQSESRSPSRSPQSPTIVPIRSSPSPARSLSSIASTIAQSPGFTSISNRMASMRDFVADSLFLAPGSRMTRTLGSELGSEFGDDWEGPAWTRSMSLAPESPAPPVDRPITQGLEGGVSQQEASEGVGEEEEEWVDEPGTWSGEDDTDHTTFFNSPAPLPPLVSAALSSLALALAPTDMWDSSLSPAGESSRILPRGCLKDRQVDGRAYDLLGQAVKRRKIVWADSARSDMDSPPAIAIPKSGTRLIRQRRQSSPSPRPAFGRITGGRQKVSGSRNEGMNLAWNTDAGAGSADSEDEAEWSHTSAIVLSTETDSLRGQGKGKAPGLGRGNLGVGRRPGIERAGSSQSSIALAHRRVSNQPPPAEVNMNIEARARPTDLLSEELGIMVSLHNPTTIPGKLVHDLLVWALILLEWLECLAVLGMKVVLEVRRGRDGVLWRQLRSRANGRQRYYL